MGRVIVKGITSMFNTLDRRLGEVVCQASAVRWDPHPLTAVVIVWAS